MFLRLILLLYMVTFCHQTKAQSKEIPLSKLLSKISNTHKVFFTYDSSLIAGKTIQEVGFSNLSLKETISLLQKLTPFHFDDLGNNYYVIYSKKMN